MIADDFVSISDGAVQRPDRETFRQQFESYFGAVESVEWADIAPPEIAIAKDGTMATVVVTKRVRVKPAGRPDAPVEDATFAWLEVWRKDEGRWLMQTIASTSRSD